MIAGTVGLSVCVSSCSMYVATASVCTYYYFIFDVTLNEPLIVCLSIYSNRVLCMGYVDITLIASSVQCRLIFSK